MFKKTLGLALCLECDEATAVLELEVDGAIRRGDKGMKRH